MKVKLYQQNCGSKIAVGIEGDEKSVTERFNSFWNHGATDGEFHWQTLTRGYFWTTTEKLKKAIFNATLFELWNQHPEMEDDESASEALAQPIADLRFEAIENKPDLVSFGTASVTPFATEVDLENYNWNGTRKK